MRGRRVACVAVERGVERAAEVDRGFVADDQRLRYLGRRDRRSNAEKRSMVAKIACFSLESGTIFEQRPLTCLHLMAIWFLTPFHRPR